MKDIGRISERYEFSFDARQLGLYLFAAAAFAALAFVLGMSVGVQWQRKKDAAAIRPAVSAPAAPPKTAASVAPAAPPVAPPVIPPAPAKPAHAPSQASGLPPGASARQSGPVPVLTFPRVLTSNTNKTAPMTREKKAAEPAAAYTVQVGAFKEKAEARAVAARLKKKGYDARVNTGPGGRGGYVYKLCVGRYGSRDEAKAAAKRLAGAGGRLRPFVLRIRR